MSKIDDAAAGSSSSTTTNDLDQTTAIVQWASTSGRAKACARRTSRWIRSRGVPITSCCSFDDFGATAFLDIGQRNVAGVPPLLVLFVSTTGDGEQCDSMKECWTALLKKNLSKSLFHGVTFSLFALGDRAYGDLFCAAGRKLAARLVQLGAIPLCPVGYGDDNTPNGGVFADLDLWIEYNFIPALLAFKKPSLADDFVIDDTPKIVPPSYKVTVLQKQTSYTSSSDCTPLSASTFLPGMDTFFRALAPAAAYDYSAGSINRNADILRLSPLKGRLVSNERITAENWYQNVQHIRIEVDVKSGTEADALYPLTATKPYDAGDVAVVMPQNSPTSVQKLLSVLPFNIQSIADDELLIERLNPDATPWPMRCSLRSLFTYCADIQGLPEREFLRSLSAFVDVEGHPTGLDQTQKLIELSESSGSALYADYIIREKRNYADVFFDFDGLRISCSSNATEQQHDGAVAIRAINTLTLEHLLGLIPPMFPRQFSIASSPSTKADVQPHFSPHLESSFVLELCVAVVDGKTPLGRNYKGLCSNFLANLNCNISNTNTLCMWQNFPEIRLWVRPGSFGRLPLTINRDILTFERPIICIGAGTGIAPLRALMRERFTILQNACSHLDQKDSMSSQESNILIFGCRRKCADFYYRDEWEHAVDSGLLRLLTAFSQDFGHKIYVQKVLKDADDGMLLVKHLLEHGGALYIAGGAKMARAVKDEIIEILGKSLPGGETEAKMFLKKLYRVGLMSVEAWS